MKNYLQSKYMSYIRVIISPQPSLNEGMGVCTAPFLWKENLYFQHRLQFSQQNFLRNTLLHFMPTVSFCAPWKLNKLSP